MKTRNKTASLGCEPAIARVYVRAKYTVSHKYTHLAQLQQIMTAFPKIFTVMLSTILQQTNYTTLPKTRHYASTLPCKI